MDDDEVVLRAFVRAFGRRYEVTSVTSGEAALQALQGARFDVAVVDFVMPGMDGIELARRIAASQPELPCVVLTGYPDLQQIIEARAQGLFVAVLAKPWEEADVDHALARALRSTKPKPPP